MGKILKIEKSRKEQTCGKCKKLIPKGSKYFKGIMNFRPAMIRCESCCLQYWEVTTSDYLYRTGCLINTWFNNYEITEDGIAQMTNEIQELLDETQEKLDNMPESLQDSDNGILLQERIDAMENCIRDLESVYVDGDKEEASHEISDALCQLEV